MRSGVSAGALSFQGNAARLQHTARDGAGASDVMTVTLGGQRCAHTAAPK
jgi:hypothetical protein